MRHLAMMATMLGIFLMAPGAAQGATDCGQVPDPGGQFQWRVAAWKIDCSTAVDLGERWAAMKGNTPGLPRMRHGKWLCRQGAQAFGWCELGRYWKTQKVVYILTRPDEDVSTWRPRFEPLWRRCGVPTWSRLKHGGKLESWGVKCAKANRVTRLYLKRIQDPNPKILGFRCSGGQLTPGVKGRHYLECSRGLRSIRWEGPPRAIFGPKGPLGPTVRPKGPLLRRWEARHYMRVALKREFGHRWMAGYSKTTRCLKRISRQKIRCTRIAWVSGDTGFVGRGTIWLRKGFWNYSFRILRLNEYCRVMGGSFEQCSRWIVVR